jgi:hypothetical protein
LTPDESRFADSLTGGEGSKASAAFEIHLELLSTRPISMLLHGDVVLEAAIDQSSVAEMRRIALSVATNALKLAGLFLRHEFAARVVALGFFVIQWRTNLTTVLHGTVTMPNRPWEVSL